MTEKSELKKIEKLRRWLGTFIVLFLVLLLCLFIVSQELTNCQQPKVITTADDDCVNSCEVDNIDNGTLDDEWFYCVDDVSENSFENYTKNYYKEIFFECIGSDKYYFADIHEIETEYLDLNCVIDKCKKYIQRNLYSNCKLECRSWGR